MVVGFRVGMVAGVSRHGGWGFRVGMVVGFRVGMVAGVLE